MCKKSLCGLVFFTLVLLFAGPPAAQTGPARARVWHVYPAMDRLYIQAVVDSAANGDTVLFHAGTYDWSDTPLTHRWENTGAIYIIEKTLTLRGESGVTLVGRPSIDGTGDALGVNAFKVIDLDTNNDVTFDCLNIQTFLRGIACGYNSYHDPNNVYDIAVPCTRNLTVKNCTFSDIHRDPISISHIGGNVLIQNNNLTGGRMGLFCDWYWSLDHLAWQPEETHIKIIGNRVATLPLRPSGYSTGLWLTQTTNVLIMNNEISSEFGITMYGTNDGAVISWNDFSDCLWGITLESRANGAVIEQNELKNLPYDGIILSGADCHGNIVRNNSIELAESPYDGIYSTANHNFYAQNKITGKGRFAIWLDSDSSGSAHHETFLANDVSQFTPFEAHYFLNYGTYENLVFGFPKPAWTYVDYGVNNLIIGGTNINSAAVQALSAMSAVRPNPREELREARKNILF